MLTCAVKLGTDGGGTSPVTWPVSFTSNDTGLGRVMMSGPAGSIDRAKQAIHAAGGVSDVLSLNFVGGVTCSPCDAGADAVCCR
jgi:hypothetical protein